MLGAAVFPLVVEVVLLLLHFKLQLADDPLQHPDVAFVCVARFDGDVQFGRQFVHLLLRFRLEIRTRRQGIMRRGI